MATAAMALAPETCIQAQLGIMPVIVVDADRLPAAEAISRMKAQENAGRVRIAIMSPARHAPETLETDFADLVDAGATIVERYRDETFESCWDRFASETGLPLAAVAVRI